MSGDTRCPYCQRRIDPGSRYAYQRITGWERKAFDPSRKHGSDIILREHLDEWACGPCVMAAKRGLLGQESMFDR